MDFDLIDECLTNLLAAPTTLQNGLSTVRKHLESMDVNSGDLDKQVLSAYQRFAEWLLQLIQNEPIPNGILALNFGLFETAEGAVQLYVTGSTEWDEDDFDWASNNDYFPEGRYAPGDLYEWIYSTFPDNETALVYVHLAVTSLFAMTFGKEHPDVLKPTLLATGFDDGDLYHIPAW